MESAADSIDHLCVRTVHLAPDALTFYVLHRSSRADAARIEEHLLICGSCRRQLVEAENVVQVVRRALTLSNSVVELHAIGEVTVTLRVHEAADGWLAHVVGPGTDLSAFRKSRAEAVAFCRSRFAELFPEHTCGGICGKFTGDEYLTSDFPWRRQCSARVK